MIGSSLSERAFHASQSPLVLRHTRLTVSLPTAPPNSAASARRTRRVLVPKNMRPRSTRRPVSSAAGRREWSHSAIRSSCLRESPAGRAARESSWRRKFPECVVPDGRGAGQRAPLGGTSPTSARTFISRPPQRGVEFGFEKLLYEAANTRPHPVFQGIEPILGEKMLTFRGA